MHIYNHFTYADGTALCKLFFLNWKASMMQAVPKKLLQLRHKKKCEAKE